MQVAAPHAERIQRRQAGRLKVVAVADAAGASKWERLAKILCDSTRALRDRADVIGQRLGRPTPRPVHDHAGHRVGGGLKLVEASSDLLAVALGDEPGVSPGRGIGGHRINTGDGADGGGGGD